MKLIRYLYLGIREIPKIIYNSIKYFIMGLFTSITIFPKYFIIGIMAILNPKKNKDIRVRGKPLIPAIMMGLSLFIYFMVIFIFSRWAVQKLRLEYLYTDVINSTEIIEQMEQDNQNSNIEDNSANNGNGDDTPQEDNVYYPNDYWDYINVPFINVNFDELRAKNSETVAWLKVNGTYINYPVVRHADNGYYLKHDFGGRYNPNGWIYSDYRSDYDNYGNNSIIYGHNLNNRTLFGSLVWVLNSSWYTNSNNYIIKLSTLNNNTNWRVFSVYMIPSEAYYLRTVFNDNNDYMNFLNTIKSRSIYDFGISLNESDKILTLSTCNDTGTERVVLHAKMVNISYK